MHAVHSIVQILNTLRRFRRKEFEGERWPSRPLGLSQHVFDVHTGGLESCLAKYIVFGDDLVRVQLAMVHSSRQCRPTGKVSVLPNDISSLWQQTRPLPPLPRTLLQGKKMSYLAV